MVALSTVDLVKLLLASACETDDTIFQNILTAVPQTLRVCKKFTIQLCAYFRDTICATFWNLSLLCG